MGNRGILDVMKTKILFCGQTRELIGLSDIEWEHLPCTVAELREQLSHQGDNWHYALTEKSCLCAVNKILVNDLHIVENGDEVAFFPPVTGG